MKEKTSIFANGLIWFGAGVSISEILTGTFLAPLGFSKGLAAIVLGHIIGCVLLFLAGLIGGRTEKSAMETVKLSFGEQGSLLFSGLNVLQLVGWTAIMIVSGASAASALVNIGGTWVWSLLIGALIIVWLLVGIRNLSRLNVVAMSGLFILTVVMSTVIFKGGAAVTAMDDSLSFGAAVELAVAMPLSWLPLISDYTREAKKPFGATLASAVIYFFVSCWMYVIGMGAAIFTGESDVGAIMMKAGLGAIALIIIVFSTVTTTFLDAYSAGVSSVSISGRIQEKPAAIAVCVVGTVLAMLTPISQFESFLYLIGSVFAPMIAIQLVDFFLLKRDSSGKKADWVNLALWLVGFVLYRMFMSLDTPMGSTFPVMLVTGALSLVVHKLCARFSKEEKAA